MKRAGSPASPTPWEICNAVETIRLAGAHIVLPSATIKIFSVNDISVMLNVSPSWVRAHMHEFPNRVRLPGGDIRIPLKDIDRALARWRIETYRPATAALRESNLATEIATEEEGS